MSIFDNASRVACWMSFADPNTNENLGVCIVDVTSEDAEVEAGDLCDCGSPKCSGNDPVKGPWVLGAVRVAYEMGCNPGGEVLMEGIPDELADLYTRYGLKKNRLYSPAEVDAIHTIMDEKEGKTKP